MFFDVDCKSETRKDIEDKAKMPMWKFVGEIAEGVISETDTIHTHRVVVACRSSFEKFHIHVPTFVIHESHASEMVERARELTRERLGSDTNLDAIWDASVYGNNGLRLAGCYKPCEPKNKPKEGEPKKIEPKKVYRRVPDPDSLYHALDRETGQLRPIHSLSLSEFKDFSIIPDLADPDQKTRYEELRQDIAQDIEDGRRRGVPSRHELSLSTDLFPEEAALLKTFAMENFRIQYTGTDGLPVIAKAIFNAKFKCFNLDLENHGPDGKPFCPIRGNCHRRLTPYVHIVISTAGARLLCWDKDCRSVQLERGSGVPLTADVKALLNAKLGTPNTLMTGEPPAAFGERGPAPIIEEPDDDDSAAHGPEENEQTPGVLGDHWDALPTEDANVLKLFAETKFMIDYENGTYAPIVKSASYNPKFKSFTLKLYTRGPSGKALCPFQESPVHHPETDYLYISISNAGARLRCFKKECERASASSPSVKLTHEVKLLLSRKIASSASAGSSSEGTAISTRRDAGDVVSNFNGIFAAPIPWQPLPTVSPDFAHLAHGHTLNYLSSHWASEGGYAVLPKEKDAQFVVAQCPNGFRVFGIKLSGPIQHRQAPHVLAAIDPVSNMVQTALDWTGAGQNADRKVQMTGPDSEFARGMVLNIVNVTVNNQYFVSKKEKTIVVAEQFVNDISFFADEEKNIAFQRSLSGSAGYLAAFFNLHYGRVFRWSQDDWYIFRENSGCWEPASNSALCKMMKDAFFSNLYVEAYQRYQAAGMGYELLASIAKVQKLLFEDFQRKILEQLKSVEGVEDRHFAGKLDSNMNLLAFQNGVLEFDRDASSWMFRKLQMEDCVSKKLNYDFGPRDEGAIREVLDLFFDPVCCTKMRGTDSLRTYVLTVLSLMLDGNTRDQAFYILYGPHGSDGKSQLKMFVQAALGHRVVLQNPTFLTTTERNPNSPTPALMECANRNAVFVDETEEQHGGRPPAYAEGAIKTFTSGGTATGRFLHQNQTTFLIRFILVHLTNTLPRVNALSNPLMRRCRVLPCDARFVAAPRPDHPNEFPIDVTMENKVKSARWCLALIYILLDHWELYNRKGNFHDPATVPLAVKEATAKFWDIMNDVVQFLSESYDVGDESKDEGLPMRSWTQLVRASDLLQDFNNRARVAERKALNAKEFGDHMTALMNGSGAFGNLKKIRVKSTSDDNVWCYYPLVPARDRLGED